MFDLCCIFVISGVFCCIMGFLDTWSPEFELYNYRRQPGVSYPEGCVTTHPSSTHGGCPEETTLCERQTSYYESNRQTEEKDVADWGMSLTVCSCWLKLPFHSN